MSNRQLTNDEEKFEENVWQAWEAFLLQMQDASEFVNTQTPLMTQLLEDTYVVSHWPSLIQCMLDNSFFVNTQSTALQY